MIQRDYIKNADSTQQNLSIIIDAPPEKVFHYLSTTDGINSWFPELSIENTDTILFDKSEGQRESLEIYALKQNEILSFDWFTGKVTFHLAELDGVTKLTFTEVVPQTFQNISRDFAGWDTHMKNIKDIVETGAVEKMDMDTFKKRQTVIKTELNK